VFSSDTFLLLYFSLCTAVFASATKQLRDQALTDGLIVLDEAINALANPAANYQKILGVALPQLRKIYLFD
jgi:hypothetical protein